jgi:hypothetical protein
MSGSPTPRASSTHGSCSKRRRSAQSLFAMPQLPFTRALASTLRGLRPTKGAFCPVRIESVPFTAMPSLALGGAALSASPTAKRKHERYRRPSQFGCASSESKAVQIEGFLARSSLARIHRRAGREFVRVDRDGLFDRRGGKQILAQAA